MIKEDIKVYKTSKVRGGVLVKTIRIQEIQITERSYPAADGWIRYENIVEIPDKKIVERYKYQSLEQALDQHDRIVNDNASYSYDDKSDVPGRFAQIQRDIEDKELTDE